MLFWVLGQFTVRYICYFSNKCWQFWDRAQNMLIFSLGCSYPLRGSTGTRNRAINRAINVMLITLGLQKIKKVPKMRYRTKNSKYAIQNHFWFNKDTFWFFIFLEPFQEVQKYFYRAFKMVRGNLKNPKGSLLKQKW